MATQLKFRHTTTNGITDTGDGIVYDLLDAFGSLTRNLTTATIAGGTNIQQTDSNGGPTVAFISGRVPTGGFTLTSLDVSIWQNESSMNANVGGRVRVYRYQPGPTITELTGSPFDDGVEMSSSTLREDIWSGDPIDQAFNENDRILVRLFLTNIGTMGDGFTCSTAYDQASGSIGDSFFNIAETVVFKAEETPTLPPPSRVKLDAVHRAASW